MAYAIRTMTLPDGYRVLEHHEPIDNEAGIRVLRSRRRNCLSYVSRDRDKLILTWHTVRCPYCGHDMPAYAMDERGRVDPLETPPRIDPWQMRQMSLFDEEILRLNTPVQPDEPLICRSCGARIAPFTGERTVEIEETGKNLRLTLKQADLRELLAFGEIQGGSFSALDQQMSVTFNLEKGRCYVTLSDPRIGTRFSYDLTQTLDDDALLRLAPLDTIARYPRIARIVRRFFARNWPAPFPFRTLDMTSPARLVAMTAFVGYPRSFYAGIPVVRGCLDRSFRRISRRLHRAPDLPALCERSGLSTKKSIRRSLFLQPSYFFYLPEVRLMEEVLNNPNLFCRFLQSRDCVFILSALHQMPELVAFYRDFAARMGDMTTLRALIGIPEEMASYAMRYVLLSDRYRRQEQRAWKTSAKESFGLGFTQQTERALIPTTARCCIEESILDCTIFGYHFSWLRSEGDYQRAAYTLHNCLARWPDSNNPVVLVTRAGQPAAAIEVKGRSAYPPLGVNNRSMDDDEEMQRVFRVWCERNHLTPADPLARYRENLDFLDFADPDMDLDLELDDDIPF